MDEKDRSSAVKGCSVAWNIDIVHLIANKLQNVEYSILTFITWMWNV